MSVADRMINPLGFKVSSYRKSAEALTTAEPAPAAAPADSAIGVAQPTVQGASSAVAARP